MDRASYRCSTARRASRHAAAIKVSLSRDPASPEGGGAETRKVDRPSDGTPNRETALRRVLRSRALVIDLRPPRIVPQAPHLSLAPSSNTSVMEPWSDHPGSLLGRPSTTSTTRLPTSTSDSLATASCSEASMPPLISSFTAHHPLPRQADTSQRAENTSSCSSLIQTCNSSGQRQASPFTKSTKRDGRRVGIDRMR